MENTEDSASLISQRALTEALGGKKKRSKALRDIAARPLPVLPQASQHPQQPYTSPPQDQQPSEPSTSTPPSPGAASKHVRISGNLDELLPLRQGSASGAGLKAASHDLSATQAAPGEAGPSQQHPSKHISAAARAAALRPSLVKGGHRKHAAPGPPPPRKFTDKQPSLRASESGASRSDRKSQTGNAIFLGEDQPGEVQRGADGSRLSILQIIDNDGENAEVLDPEKLKAQREEFLMKHQATDAKSVPALHKRLIQRREILSALTHWASSVTKKRDTSQNIDEHVDAEQLEEESKQPKTGGIGVGASLRAYWNATVQEEVELRFNTMRIAWEKEAAADMAELKDLREKHKKMKTDLEDTKQQLAGMNIKYEVAQKQVISAQRAVPGKQAAAEPEADAAKVSAGQQALVEATVRQLKMELNGFKGQVDAANAKVEMYANQAAKAESDLEATRAENASLITKLHGAEVQLAQAAETAKEQVGKAKATDGDSAGKNSGKVTPQAGSTPIKQGGDGGAEVQKLRKDLDRLQNEHAKLQVSMKFKAAEVEKLNKELKEARMKSPPRANSAAASAGAGAAASERSGSRASPARQPFSKSKTSRNKNGLPKAAEPTQDLGRSNAEGSIEMGAPENEGSADPGLEQQESEDKAASNIDIERAAQAKGEGSEGAEQEEAGSGPAHKKSLKQHGSRGSRGLSPDKSVAQISSLEKTVAKLKEQLKSAEAKAAIHDKAAAQAQTVTPKSAGTKLAKSDAHLQMAESEIKELKALVRRLQTDLKELQGSSSIQQQELTVEVELNRRMRLLDRLRTGATKVQDTLSGASVPALGSEGGGGGGEEEDLASHLQQRVIAGNQELLELVQTLEDEFGGPAGGAQQEQEVQGYLSHRRSSVSQRFLLDPNDLSDLLRSSSRKIQKLASVRVSLSGAVGPPRSKCSLVPGATNSAVSGPGGAQPAQGAKGTHPASARSVAFHGVDAGLRGEDEQDDNAQQEASMAALFASRGDRASCASSALGADWDGRDDQHFEQAGDAAAGDPGLRYVPFSAQLPGVRGPRTGVGVSTFMGRKGPQVFGARPTGNLHGSIEDATRWGGMFERLHASYLDPNGVWRVYTQREGQEPSSPGHSLGDSLQPLLAGAQSAAEHAEVSAKAAAAVLTPHGCLAEGAGGVHLGHCASGLSSRVRGSSRGAALQPTRRPQSACPGVLHTQLQQQSPQPGASPPQQLPAARSLSPPTQRGAQYAWWPTQLGAQGAAPPLLKHNVYQQQPDQPQGGFSVRMLTATPQKGIMLRSRPKSAHPNSSGGWELGPGEGEPQYPPAPQSHVTSHLLDNSLGLSVPLQSWALHPGHTPSMPAGGLLHASGSSFPVFNGFEMMTRVELIGAVKEMQAYLSSVAQRYERMGTEQQVSAQVQAELAIEVAAAREHWVAENEYNSQLEDELWRLHSILERVVAEARRDSTGPDENQEAGQLDSHDSSGVQEACAALERVQQVEELQEMHLSQAEAAAERINLPSPSSIRAKFKPSSDQFG